MSESPTYSLNNIDTLIAMCIMAAAGAVLFNAGPIIFGTIGNTYAMSNAELGTLVSFANIGNLITTLTASYWVPRLHWQKTLSIATLPIVVGMFLLWENTEMFYAFLAMPLISFGAAAYFTVSLAVLSRAKHVSQAFGLKLVFEMGIAGVLAYFLSKVLTSSWGYGGFVLMLLSFFLLSALSILFMPDNFIQKEHQKLDAEQEASPPFLKHLVKELSNISKSGYLSALILFIQFLAMSGAWNFLERIGSSKNLSPDTVSHALSFSILSGVLGAMTVTMIGNRWGERLPAYLGYVVIIVTFIILSNAHTGLSFTIGTIAFSIMLQYIIAYQMALIVSSDNSGKIVIAIPFILSLAGMSGSAVAGHLSTLLGFSIFLKLVSVITAINMLLTVLLFRRKAERATLP